MMDEQVYLLDVQQHIQMALDENARQLDNWNKLKAAWLVMADIARAGGAPGSERLLPEKPVPAWKRTVTATPFVLGQPYKITDEVGPDRVADGTLELPKIPSYEESDYPPNVTHIRQYEGWQDTWSAYPDDTTKPGTVVDFTDPQFGPVKLMKIGGRGWGNLRLNHYKRVG